MNDVVKQLLAKPLAQYAQAQQMVNGVGEDADALEDLGAHLVAKNDLLGRHGVLLQSAARLQRTRSRLSLWL